MYDEGTGVFTHRRDSFRASGKRMILVRAAGDVARPTGDGRGWVNICFDGKTYAAHRLAWYYVTGEWPSMDIDHINRVRDDNRFANLRHISRAENLKNRAVRRDSVRPDVNP